MPGEIERGYCNYCQNLKELRRTYYRYPILGHCACHSEHFELIRTCHNCTPRLPSFTLVAYPNQGNSLFFIDRMSFKAINLSKIANDNVQLTDDMKVHHPIDNTMIDLIDPKFITYYRRFNEETEFYIPSYASYFESYVELLNRNSFVYYDENRVLDNGTYYVTDLCDHDLERIYEDCKNRLSKYF